MSLVPARGAIRHCYEQARSNDIEYHSANFWRAILQSLFREERYLHFAETSPDGSGRRVDIVVSEYTASSNSSKAILWVECKRPTENAVEVEKQALDAAWRYLQSMPVESVHTMSTIGTSFRIWTVERRQRVLVPLHGTSARSMKSEYIDADSRQAQVLLRVVEGIKRNSDNSPEMPRPSLPPPQQTRARRSSGPIEVSVQSTRQGTLEFQDEQGRRVCTTIGNWEPGRMGSAGIWICRVGHKDYYTQQRIA